MNKVLTSWRAKKETEDWSGEPSNKKHAYLFAIILCVVSGGKGERRLVNEIPVNTIEETRKEDIDWCFSWNSSLLGGHFPTRLLIGALILFCLLPLSLA